MHKDFINLAKEVSKYSSDPNTKVGCVLVRNGETVGMGFNRMPTRALFKFPWDRKGKLYNTKYPYVIHAEMSALKLAGFKKDFDCYVTLFPCSNCAKLLIESGVNTIYYLEDKYADTEDIIASKKLLSGCGVPFLKVNGD